MCCVLPSVAPEGIVISLIDMLLIYTHTWCWEQCGNKLVTPEDMRSPPGRLSSASVTTVTLRGRTQVCSSPTTTAFELAGITTGLDILTHWLEILSTRVFMLQYAVFQASDSDQLEVSSP